MKKSLPYKKYLNEMFNDANKYAEEKLRTK